MGVHCRHLREEELEARRNAAGDAGLLEGALDVPLDPLGEHGEAPLGLSPELIERLVDDRPELGVYLRRLGEALGDRNLAKPTLQPVPDRRHEQLGP